MEKKFDEVEVMTKEEAINEVKTFFEGNDNFIEQVVLLIYSTHHFEKIASMEISQDDWNWEKFLIISIYSNAGFKQFCYRKGNKKYENVSHGVGNGTSNIEGFKLTIYHTENQKKEEFEF